MEDEKSKIENVFRDLIRMPASPVEKPSLVANRCSACKRYFLGNRMVCPHCFSDSFVETLLSGRGTLYSFTRARLAPFGFSLPLALGLVDLPEGLRIWSPLVSDSEEPFKIGMEMELVVGAIRRDESGNEVLGFKFKPVGVVEGG